MAIWALVIAAIAVVFMFYFRLHLDPSGWQKLVEHCSLLPIFRDGFVAGEGTTTCSCVEALDSYRYVLKEKSGLTVVS